MKIGQLCFFNLSSPAKNPYGTKIANSKYQNQIGPTESKSYKNWKKKDI
jgi:dCTP deaminase